MKIFEFEKMKLKNCLYLKMLDKNINNRKIRREQNRKKERKLEGNPRTKNQKKLTKTFYEVPKTEIKPKPSSLTGALMGRGPSRTIMGGGLFPSSDRPERKEGLSHRAARVLGRKTGRHDVIALLRRSSLDGQLATSLVVLGLIVLIILFCFV
jgi:hypothetical protein